LQIISKPMNLRTHFLANLSSSSPVNRSLIEVLVVLDSFSLWLSRRHFAVISLAYPVAGCVVSVAKASVIGPTSRLRLRRMSPVRRHQSVKFAQTAANCGGPCKSRNYSKAATNWIRTIVDTFPFTAELTHLKFSQARIIYQACQRSSAAEDEKTLPFSGPGTDL